MSEKGQGEESATGGAAGAAAGTATGAGGGVAAGAAGGGGSQADQSGPADDPFGGLTPRDFPAPPTPEEPEPAEPEFPGGGPTDTRSGWDKPPEAESDALKDDFLPYDHDEAVRAVEMGELPPGPPGPKIRRLSPDSSPELDGGAEPSPNAKDAAEARRQRAYNDAMRARDAQREREQGPQPEPPPLEDSKAPDQGTTGSYFDPDDEKPVLS